MNLGIILSPGDSLQKQKQTGQLERLIEYYLKPYLKKFRQVVVFSYGRQDQALVLPKNLKVVYVYRLDQYRSVDIIRVFQAPGGIPAIIAKVLFRKPYVVTYGYDYVSFVRNSGHPLLALSLGLIISLVLRLARNVIVTDRKNLSIVKSVYIPNGVDTAKFIPGKKRRPNLVLSVGRLEKQKNYDLLIGAVSRLHRQIKLVIIGRGSQGEKLVSLASRLKVNFRIIENLPHLSLRQWYQKAAVFALTSKYEGHPKTLIEAMSCGCPCLTTNFSGNPVEAGNSGLVAGNEREFTLKLEKLLSEPALAEKLGLLARKQTISRYNITKLINQEIKLLCQLN